MPYAELCPPTATPRPFQGSFEVLMRMSDWGWSELLRQNRGYLQRRNRTTVDIVCALLSDLYPKRFQGKPFIDPEVMERMNQALEREGYVPVPNSHDTRFRTSACGSYRWEFRPNWGCHL